MPALVSTITSKGQMTMPAEIRRLLGLRAGDRVEFVVGPDGRVSLRALNQPASSLFGLLAHLKPDPAYPDDDSAIGDQVVADDEATKSPQGRRRVA